MKPVSVMWLNQSSPYQSKPSNKTVSSIFSYLYEFVVFFGYRSLCILNISTVTSEQNTSEDTDQAAQFGQQLIVIP